VKGVCKPKEVKVFRLYYKRSPRPEPIIQRTDRRIDKLDCVFCEVPEEVRWSSKEDPKVFFGDDYLLECALNSLISEGYEVIAVLGPMKMWVGDEASYQIVVRGIGN